MTRLRWPLLLLAAASVCALLAVSSGAEDDPMGPAKPVTGDSEAALTARLDGEIAKVWERDGVTPAQRSTDEEFLRRVYFDITGGPPTPAEILAFAENTDERKREKLIDALWPTRALAATSPINGFQSCSAARRSNAPAPTTCWACGWRARSTRARALTPSCTTSSPPAAK
jgi:hypothetical protein